VYAFVRRASKPDNHEDRDTYHDKPRHFTTIDLRPRLKRRQSRAITISPRFPYSFEKLREESVFLDPKPANQSWLEVAAGES
jgi:hypothetical protein